MIYCCVSLKCRFSPQVLSWKMLFIVHTYTTHTQNSLLLFFFSGLFFFFFITQTFLYSHALLKSSEWTEHSNTMYCLSFNTPWFHTKMKRYDLETNKMLYQDSRHKQNHYMLWFFATCSTRWQPLFIIEFLHISLVVHISLHLISNAIFRQMVRCVFLGSCENWEGKPNKILQVKTGYNALETKYSE